MDSGNNHKPSRIRVIAYIIGFAFFVGAFIYGWDYYSMPLSHRPHSPLHLALKPGGPWGHGFGIAGTLMILLLFTYSLRKRKALGVRWGATRRWLSVHIFFGVVGPLLVTLHTALKFNGIISVGYFAMAAVALSGVFGRYVYVKIPRSASGAELKLKDIEDQEKALEADLVERLGVERDTAAQVFHVLAEHQTRGTGLVALIRGDIRGYFLRRKMQQSLRALLGELSPAAADEAMEIARRKAALRKKINYLETSRKLFHYWHVIHKPFAYVMVIVVSIHIVVAILFGYTWII